MIKDHDFYNATLSDGPFPIGEWSVFMPSPYYSLVVPWFIQNRGQFTLLVHPNTGFEYEDHSIWASWTGEKQQLDMSIFTKNTQTNEFGHWRGDNGNPVCMPTGVVCGNLDPVYNASTAVLCCDDLVCGCAKQDKSLCRCIESA